MGKSTEPPTCRFCGKQHRGTCMDHEALGAISSQADVRQQRIAKATEVIASIKPKAKASGLSRKVDGAGSTPVRSEGGASTKPSKIKQRGEKALGPASKGSRPRGAKAKAGSSVSSPPTTKRIPRMDKPAKSKFSDEYTNTDPMNGPIVNPKGRGRPKLHPDRKAYLAEKARERRAKQKAKP